MATREVRKNRAAHQSPSKTVDLKNVPSQDSKEDILDENRKDTGQEKDAASQKTFDKKKGSGLMDSPRYSRAKEKSRERSSSPFRRNVVQPLPAEAGLSTTPGNGSTLSLRSGPSPTPGHGSTLSLRSETSSKSKEAWPERKDSLSSIKKKAGSLLSLKSHSADSAKKDEKEPKGTEMEMANLKGEGRVQNAYVPYTYARNYIARITGDFAAMQEKHVRIVRDITLTYKDIEDETQAQFNVFVLTLKKQFSGKLSTFKQVIELYSTQHARKEQYWKETVQSLTERINKMLKDRKILLINNREEIEKLEHEKAQLMAQLTGQMDQEKSAATHASKTLEKRIQEVEDDKKKLQEELDKEKDAVRCLKALGVGAGVVVATAHQENNKENASMEKSAKDKKIPADQLQLIEHVAQLEKDRHDLMLKLKQLEGDVTRHSVECGVLQEKNRMLMLRTGDIDRLREQHFRLESQYKALTLVVGATPATSAVAKEKEPELDKERAMMEEERRRLAKEIEKWEREFRKKNKRELTEADKSDSVKEMYASMGEAQYMVDSLDIQKETLKAVQSGVSPPLPDFMPPVIGAQAEPEVSVVEVKVPDPDIVVQLEKSQAAVDSLNSQQAVLLVENADMKSRLAALESKAVVAGVIMGGGEDQEKLAKLSRELEEKNEELENLKAEKREMLKEIRKMRREQAKLQAQMASMDPELPRLLEMVAVLVQAIHGEHADAARAVKTRLKTASEAVKPLSEREAAADKAFAAWEHNYKNIHGSFPDDSDRDDEGRKLKAAAHDAGKALEIKQLEVRALRLLTTGIYTPKEQVLPKSAVTGTDVEEQLTSLDNKVIDLEAEKEQLQAENESLQRNLEALEDELQNFKEVGASVLAVDPEQMAKLEHEIDGLNAALQQERAAHDTTRDELEALQKQLQTAKDDLSQLQGQSQSQVLSATSVLEAQLASREEQLVELKARIEELEKERLSSVPMDAAKEIKNLHNKIAMLEKKKEELKTSRVTQAAALIEARSQLDIANMALGAQRATNRDLEARVKAARGEKENAVKELTTQIDKKEQQRAALETKLKLLQISSSGAAALGAMPTTGGSVTTPALRGAASVKVAAEQSAALKREIRELNARIKQLEMEARKGSVAGDSGAADKNTQKRNEKILKDLEKRLDLEISKNAKLTEVQKQKDEELKGLSKEVRDNEVEIARLQAELAALGLAAKEGAQAAGRLKVLEAENKKLAEDNKVLTENFNSERVLRKKYYNMVEDMKGKIRVYCRARPLSDSELKRGNFSVVKSPDEYTITVSTAQRGNKEFQFDQVFMEDSQQEKIFEDTNNLIQSAVDGYNVCIFAYGQTGSGKTFTMIGDHAGQYPGIALRAFTRIFEMAEENKSKFSMTVTAYMLELYNDKLIDLFAKPDTYDEDKLEIKKDNKGMVFVPGAVVKPASNAKELTALFEAGSKNRHTASTKMNAESSRSHLVIGIVMESTSRSTGNVVKGKLSLVDLAGSERVGKTGASAETLKEAMSINKSLSALGDVISALSSEQQFIPYRNSKLTMLMQDSLGGNAKTLMFVNISPADYNADETVISLMYASRVKLITNDASKNADNKEIARLKAVIAKLKAGEKVEVEEAV